MDDAGFLAEGDLALQRAAFCDWLVRAFGYGFDMHATGDHVLPPGVTVRDLAEAWYRQEGNETVDVYETVLRGELGLEE